MIVLYAALLSSCENFPSLVCVREFALHPCSHPCSHQAYYDVDSHGCLDNYHLIIT
jgi:hypothetical protein